MIRITRLLNSSIALHGDWVCSHSMTEIQSLIKMLPTELNLPRVQARVFHKRARLLYEPEHVRGCADDVKKRLSFIKIDDIPSQMSPFEIGNVSVGLARVEHCMGEKIVSQKFWESLLERIYDKRDVLTSTCWVQITLSATLRESSEELKVITTALAAEDDGLLEMLSPDEKAILAVCLGQMGANNPKIINSLIKHCTHSNQICRSGYREQHREVVPSPQNITDLMWSLAMLTYKGDSVYKELAHHLCILHTNEGNNKLSYRRPKKDSGTSRFDVVIEHFETNTFLTRMEPADQTRALWSLAVAKCKVPLFIKSFTVETAARFAHFSAQDLLSTAWSFSRLSAYSPEYMYIHSRESANRLAQNSSFFNKHEIAYLLKSYSTIVVHSKGVVDCSKFFAKASQLHYLSSDNSVLPENLKQIASEAYKQTGTASPSDVLSVSPEIGLTVAGSKRSIKKQRQEKKRIIKKALRIVQEIPDMVAPVEELENTFQEEDVESNLLPLSEIPTRKIERRRRVRNCPWSDPAILFPNGTPNLLQAAVRGTLSYHPKQGLKQVEI